MNKNIAELHRVAVYGSLKKNFGNHESFLGESVFVKATRTDEPRFDMVSLSMFPGVYDGGTMNVEVELYLVDDQQLVMLDGLESNGRMYQRELVWLEGEDTPAWMYLYLNPQYAMNTEHRDYRVKRENGVVSWLPDPNPFEYPKFNVTGVRAKWAGQRTAAKSHNDDTNEVAGEILVDAVWEDDVEWCPEPDETSQDEEFGAMEQWLHNSCK
jgi:gamma-glutamylcyclotransferase (GGCT)/AIG2-like uncharacterized protein YtfP